jgi:hypothetical protein
MKENRHWYNRCRLGRRSDVIGNGRVGRATEELISSEESVGHPGTPELVILCSACRRLNDQRIDLDGKITTLLTDDCCSDEIWQELGDVLEELGDATERLAQVSATQLTEMRAKAEVLAILMRSNDADGGPVVPHNKTWALTLSLTDDLAGLTATASWPQGGGSPGLRRQ